MSTRTREAAAGIFSTNSVGIPSPGAGAASQVALVLSADPDRRNAVVVNTGTATVYLSSQQTNSIGASFPLLAGAGFSMTHAGAVYAFMGFGTTTDGVLSTYVETGER